MIVKINGINLMNQVQQWLQKNKFPYSVKLNYNDPFNQRYNVELTDPEHLFLTKLKWGV